MKEEYLKFESKIKKKHVFSWTPKFESDFQTNLNKKVFLAIAAKAFEKLDWEIIFQDDLTIEGLRKTKYEESTEKITVSYDKGIVKVRSVSLRNGMWDNGSNSKRVKLYIHVFQQTENKYDDSALAALEVELDKARNWDDYEIPTNLPLPIQRNLPSLWLPIVGGTISAIFMGWILAYISLHVIYFIGLFEVGVAFVLVFAITGLIRLSNYTNYTHLHYLLISMILITYSSNQYFQYLIVQSENNLQDFSFFIYLLAKFELGLKIDSLDTGWIGLVIKWILQLVITYSVGLLRLISGLTRYQIERVPQEVAHFAYFHFVKDKTEEQVRSELSKMGWIKNQDQNEVFEAIGANQNAIDLRRVE